MKDLNDYALVQGDCKECVLYLEEGCCNTFYWVTGDMCNGVNVLKKKKKFVTCTKENTNVGDTVYRAGDINPTPLKVLLISKYEHHFIVEDTYREYDTAWLDMRHFKIREK